MAFHSYPGHWTRDTYGNAACFGDYRRWMDKFNVGWDELATGAFFYGGDIRIPNVPFLRDAVRFNREFFCPPEADDVVHTYPDRGRRMTKWLAEVMGEAKRCGMTVQFSTELRECDNDYNLALVDRIIEDYPTIDVLEFITREGGGSREFSSEAYAKQTAYFEEIVTGEDAAALDKKFRRQPADCEIQVKDFAYNIRLVNHLKTLGWDAKHGVQLAAGEYCVQPVPAQVVVDLAERHLPEDVWFTLMPGHSSRVVADNVAQLKISPKLLARTIVHSWIEFDGYMMLQQYSGQGVFDLATRESHELDGAPVPGIMFNHWRTGPNAVSFRYVGELPFGRDLRSDEFLRRYARRIGVAPDDVSTFAENMAVIDRLSDQRAIAGNIGFTIGWPLDRRNNGIGPIWWWGTEPVEKAAAEYAKMADDFQAMRERCTSEGGRAVLDILRVGTELSTLHLRGVRTLQYIPRKYFDYSEKVRRMPDPETLSDEDRKFIVDHCDRAERDFSAYLRLMAANLFDRGEEGMLLTYYWQPAVLCHNIRAFYGGKGDFIETNAEKGVVPLPLVGGDSGDVREQK